jgi:hypothetical protein
MKEKPWLGPVLFVFLALLSEEKKKAGSWEKSKGVKIQYMNGSRYFDCSWYVDLDGCAKKLPNNNCV